MGDGGPPILDPEDNALAARLARHVQSWRARIPAWNGQVTDYTTRLVAASNARSFN
jgi:hypothetical protein